MLSAGDSLSVVTSVGLSTGVREPSGEVVVAVLPQAAALRAARPMKSARSGCAWGYLGWEWTGIRDRP